MIFMKRLLFLLILLSVGMLKTEAQVNRFDVPAQSTYVDQYVPLSYGEMMLIAMGQAAQEAQLKEQFEQNVERAYNYLEMDNNYWFIYYATQALKTGYYNSTLYYNLGIAYYLEGEKRKARKFLKRAKRKGSYKAGIVLSRMKKKGVIDKSYFER